MTDKRKTLEAAMKKARALVTRDVVDVFLMTAETERVIADNVPTCSDRSRLSVWTLGGIPVQEFDDELAMYRRAYELQGEGKRVAVVRLDES